jgi:hypothetical protein
MSERRYEWKDSQLNNQAEALGKKETACFNNPTKQVAQEDQKRLNPY